MLRNTQHQDDRYRPLQDWSKRETCPRHHHPRSTGVTMKRDFRFRCGFAWLELLLALVALALAFQLLPSLWFGAAWLLDVRNWPRTVWFLTNCLVVLTLVGIRFVPDLYKDWRERRERRASERAKKQKQRERKEQRKTLERMMEAQKRRVY